MSECSFCGAAEKQEYPLCHSCGAIRYPVENILTGKTLSDRQQTLKLSASVVAAIVIPGGFVVLAFMGINHLNQIVKNKKNK